MQLLEVALLLSRSHYGHYWKLISYRESSVCRTETRGCCSLQSRWPCKEMNSPGHHGAMQPGKAGFAQPSRASPSAYSHGAQLPPRALENHGGTVHTAAVSPAAPACRTQVIFPEHKPASQGHYQPSSGGAAMPPTPRHTTLPTPPTTLPRALAGLLLIASARCWRWEEV